MNILEINQRNLSLLDVNQLKAFLDIFKGVSNPKAKSVIKDLTRELGTRKMEAVEEASIKDIIKAVKSATKKIGGIIDKVFDDKGFQDAYAKYVDNPKDKNRLKKIQDYTNGMLGDMSEESDLEEAAKFWTVTITKKAGKLFKGQTVDVKARNSAEAIKKGIKQMKGNPALVPGGSVDAVLGESTEIEEAKDSVMDQVKAIIKNKQAAKINGKMIDMQTASFISQIYDKVKGTIKKKMENDKIENLVNLAQKVMAKESTDLEENIGVKDGRRVVVKALTKPAALRLKKKLRNKFSSWDTSIDKDGLSMIVPNEKPIIRYIQKQPEVDTIGEAYDSDEKHKMDPKSHVELNKETGMYCVYNIKGKKLAEFKTKEEAEEYAVKNHDLLMKESVNEAYDSDEKHTMDPKSHVELNKETGMYCVYNIKGKKVKEFESKEDAEEYAVKNHDLLMKESADLEEAALPFKELEKAWIRTKGNDKKREKLVKKHKLKPLISNVRQGSIKLGPMNDLKAKNGNHTMAGLDADGELIFISNNPVRIHYPSNTKDRPKGEEIRENSMAHQRLVRVVEIALRERPENTNEFIKESNIDLTMTPSSIQKAYKQFNIKK